MLLILLAVVCLIPPLTILGLWFVLPPVRANELRAEVMLVNGPEPAYYQLDVEDRAFMPDLSVVVRNTGDKPWTNINVRINRFFNVYDHEYAVEPGQQRSYLASRFLARGVFYDMRQNPIREVLVYARLPDGSRATYWQRFER
jgi:hypothetical protein